MMQEINQSDFKYHQGEVVHRFSSGDDLDHQQALIVAINDVARQLDGIKDALSSLAGLYARK